MHKTAQSQEVAEYVYENTQCLRVQYLPYGSRHVEQMRNCRTSYHRHYGTLIRPHITDIMVRLLGNASYI